jgi:hypothetical protein
MSAGTPLPKGVDLSVFLTQNVQQRLRFPPDKAHESERREQWTKQFRAWEIARADVDARYSNDTASAAMVASEPTRLSKSIFYSKDFLSQEECAELIALASMEAEVPKLWNPDTTHRTKTSVCLDDLAGSGNCHAKRLLEVVRLRAGTVFDIHFQESPSRCQITFSAPEAVSTNSPSIGLHVDQNNGNGDRWATVLVYLNTLPAGMGGSTTWPCAAESAYENHSSNEEESSGGVEDYDPETGAPSKIMNLQDAGAHLLKAGITCTSDAIDVVTGAEGEIDVGMVPGTVSAAYLASAAGKSGVTTTPVSGEAVMFYNVTLDTAEPDPRSWHGGLSVANACPFGKWTLQMFATFPPSPENRVANSQERVAFLKKHSFSS